MEKWKDIKDYENYQISSLGKIKRKSREQFVRTPWGGITTRKIPEMTLKPVPLPTGYLRVFLRKEGDKKSSTFYVHRLVAQAFISNPESKPQINHKNGVKIDNRADNLEWVTNSENQIHKYRELGQKNHSRMKSVMCIETGRFFESLSGASRETGIGMTTLWCHLHRKKGYTSPRGLHFRYMEEKYD